MLSFLRNRGTKALHTAADTVLGTLDKGTSHKELGAVLEPLQQAYTKYSTLLNEIEAFSKQDKWGETRDQINEITRSTRASAMYAYTVLDKAGSQQHSLATKPASIISKHTRRTRSSCTSVSSTHARRLALAEAAAAKKQSEFERIMAERESENKQREAEEEFHREQMRAQHELNMAMLAAKKREAVADAKLKAIEQSILDEEDPSILPELLGIEDARSRTQSWINSQDQQNDIEHDQSARPTPPPGNAPAGRRPNNAVGEQFPPFAPKGFAGNPPIYKPVIAHPEVVIANQYIEGIVHTNQQIVANLARQNLPKCHPDVFDGDPTLFHPWKRSFQAMTQDASLSPSQEIAYLRNYTKGKVQDLVDHFRMRQQDDPANTLHDLWAELERRFGNTTVLTETLLIKLRDSAKFTARDKTRLQIFADVCNDVDNQMAALPGLACLNYPNAIKPIVENLPSFLKFKWEKQVVKYAEENNDKYPTFHQFATMIQKQARQRNHPNILAFEHPIPDDPPNRDEKGAKTRQRRVFKTGSEDPGEEHANIPKEKYCPFHERKGHELSECKAFGEKTLEEKTKWVKDAGICFRCLIGKHRAKKCKENVKCDKYKSNRHLDTTQGKGPETGWRGEGQRGY